MVPLISAMTLLAAAAPPPPPPPPLAATAKWVINYADSFCLLSRDRTLTEPGVAFRTRPFADEHEILLMLAPTNERPFNQEGKLIVADKETDAGRWVSMAVSKKGNVKLVETTIKIAEMAGAATSGKIRISVANRLDAAVQLPKFAKAVAALRACEDDLAKRWKIVRTWAVPPVPVQDPRSTFRAEDYPAAMLNKDRIGSVRALLLIDQTGSPTACRVIETSGEPAFEQKVCEVLHNRARFKPARDSNDRPVASYYLGPNVRFRLEF